MGQHGIVTCTCGRVVAQCRCPGAPTVEIRRQACERCQRFAVTPTEPAAGLVDLWQRAHADYAVLWDWLYAHFPDFIARQARETPSSQVIIALLTQYMQADDGQGQPEPQYRRWLDKRAIQALQPAQELGTYY